MDASANLDFEVFVKSDVVIVVKSDVDDAFLVVFCEVCRTESLTHLTRASIIDVLEREFNVGPLSLGRSIHILITFSPGD